MKQRKFHARRNSKWWVSDFNFTRDVVRHLNLPRVKDVVISDETLRDGQQHPGVVFSAKDKLTIAGKLDEIGIGEINAGMPVMSQEEATTIKQLANAGLKAPLICMGRCREEDVNAVIKSDVSRMRLVIPTGLPLRLYELKKTPQELLDLAVKTVDYAKAHGLYVSIATADSTRTELRILMKFCATLAKEAKVDRIRVADTVGCMHPQAMQYLTEKVKSVSNGVPIEIHCHDDLGLATANTLAAMMGGATFLTASVNGLGERAGNAALEELVIALLLLYGLDTGIRFDKLTELSRVVEKLSLVPISPMKSIVGSDVFAHESGIVVAAILNNPLAYQPFTAEIVGQETKILIGKKTGATSLKWKLQQLGFSTTEETLLEILKQVKSLSEKKKGVLSDEELAEIARKTTQMSLGA